jgi:CheY-like chemotaxis protein
MSPLDMNQAYALESVYLIDDHPLDGWIAGQIIGKHRFTKHLVVFAEGAKALTAIELALTTREEKRLPQLIQLDIEMPLYSGWDVLAHPRAKCFQTKAK